MKKAKSEKRRERNRILKGQGGKEKNSQNIQKKRRGRATEGIGGRERFGAEGTKNQITKS